MSISNSNDRLPNLPFVKVWLSTTIFFVSTICFWNYYWLQKGIYLTTIDNMQLWTHHRSKVKGDENVVIIGTSRMLTAIDLDTINRKSGKIPIQLSIAANSPLSVLENLANDESFNGIVISDFEELIIYHQAIFRNDTKKDLPTYNSDEVIEFYEKSNFSQMLEFKLRLWTEYIVASPNLGNNPAERMRNLLFVGFDKGAIFDNAMRGEVRLDFNRFLKFNAEEMTGDTLDRLYENQKIGFNNLVNRVPAELTKFKEIINRIEENVKKIQGRGGRVVFVAMPKNKEIWEINERGFPKKTFWDTFASNSSGITIHFSEHPTLAKFECPDGSHLDSKDAVQFTEELMKILGKDLQK